MSTILDELVKLLALERIEENLFRGQSQDLGWGTVFSGQVLGQALFAAVQTVPPERHVHSLHAYFLRPGRVDRPIVYDVDRIRDGTSFTTRRVVAIQGGQAIFNLAASFQKIEAGFEHQDPMPEAAPPETVPTEQERTAAFAQRLPKAPRDRALAPRPFELRPVEADDDPFLPAPQPPRRLVWLKTAGALPDDREEEGEDEQRHGRVRRAPHEGAPRRHALRVRRDAGQERAHDERDDEEERHPQHHRRREHAAAQQLLDASLRRRRDLPDPVERFCSSAKRREAPKTSTTMPTAVATMPARGLSAASTSP